MSSEKPILAKGNETTSLEDGENSLREVGAVLKKARQEKSLEIKNLAEDLKMGEEQILALEKGLKNSLPETVYIKAMIRRIAEKLNLDSTSLMEKLQINSNTTQDHIESIKSREGYKSKSLYIFLSCLGLILIAIAFMRFNYIKSKQSKSLLTIKQTMISETIKNSNAKLAMSVKNKSNYLQKVSTKNGKAIFEEIQESFQSEGKS